MGNYAQGRIEYLVILAVVIVIGLLIVGLASTFFDSSSGVSNSINKAISSSSPISISDFAIDLDGQGIVKISNHSGENLTISKVETIDSRNVYDEALMQGESVLLYTSNNWGCECEEGQSSKECVFDVYTTSRYGIERRETVTVSVDCVVNVSSPRPLTKPYYCADYTKDWIVDMDEFLRVTAYRTADEYYVNAAGYDGYATVPGSHDGPFHCADLDKDWNISDAEWEKTYTLWQCPDPYKYDYNFEINDWDCLE